MESTPAPYPRTVHLAGHAYRTRDLLRRAMDGDPLARRDERSVWDAHLRMTAERITRDRSAIPLVVTDDRPRRRRGRAQFVIAGRRGQLPGQACTFHTSTSGTELQRALDAVIACQQWLLQHRPGRGW